MKKIPLTRDKFALVDEEDYDNLNKYSWHCSADNYAVRTTREKGKVIRIYMHRVVAKTPEGLFTDHINGERLDNRKENLRFCTNRQNQQNRPKPSNNTSGYKGVVWNKKSQKWQAGIMIKSKQTYLGCFLNKEEAYKAYCRAASKFFGNFSRV